MSAQRDFWKPKPYDFEAVVDAVNPRPVCSDHRRTAVDHVQTNIRTPGGWRLAEIDHDDLDREYFGKTDIAPKDDVWDNRRKVGAK
jgi:hypothetical protein